MMIELNINNLTKFYGANKIFERISFEVKTGERIGLIGTNGCGKTTLMKILMGVEDYKEGNISFRKDTRVGYLNQISFFEANTTVKAVLQLAFQDVYEIKGQMEQLEHRMTTEEGDALDKTVKQYSRLMERYEHRGGYEIETKITKVSEGLQITDIMLNMEFDMLSGGEKTRVILAKILLEESDILLLDEPTNHLDIDSREVLEETLCNFEGTLLFVSHDRYFIDKVADKILAIEDNILTEYAGDYSYYLEECQKKTDRSVEHKKAQPQVNTIKNERLLEKTTNPKSDTHIKLATKRKEELEILIEELEKKRSELEKQINLNNTNSILLQELGTEMEILEQELLRAYTDWEDVLS